MTFKQKCAVKIAAAMTASGKHHGDGAARYIADESWRVACEMEQQRTAIEAEEEDAARRRHLGGEKCKHGFGVCVHGECRRLCALSCDGHPLTATIEEPPPCGCPDCFEAARGYRTPTS